MWGGVHGSEETGNKSEMIVTQRENELSCGYAQSVAAGPSRWIELVDR